MVSPVQKFLTIGLLFSSLFLAASGASAQIYKTTDAEGNVVFTDRPAAGNKSEQVDLQRTNSTPPPPVMPVQSTEEESKEPAEPETRVAITAPAPETTIPMGPGNFSVTAQIEPGLARGQSLQLSLDGEAQGEPQASGYWDLTNVFRGAHDLVVSVIDAQGEVVSSSEPVRVYVMRPSVN